MSFNIELSYLNTGFVSVKVPTAELANTSVDFAPFRLQIQTAGNNAYEHISSGGWTAESAGGITTYSRSSALPLSSAVELAPLSGVTSGNFFFPPTGFIFPSATPTIVYKDNVGPTLTGITELSSTSLFENASVPISGGQQSGSKYYIAKFSEGVSGVSNQSFNVSLTQNGASTPPSQAHSVQSLWLNGTAWSTSSTNGVLASHYLVTATVPAGNTSEVTLKPATTILSVQEMIAAPSSEEVNGTFRGSLPTGPDTSWMKVSLSGNATEFLNQNYPSNSQVPVLEYVFAGITSGSPPIVIPTPAPYVVAGKELGVLYLGFNTDIQEPSRTPINIKFEQTTSGTFIKDFAGNALVSTASVTPAEYIPKWGDDTTTINEMNLVGSATGIYNTAGIASKDLNGNPLYDSNKDRIGMDTIDLSDIISSSILINAEGGTAAVYFDNKAMYLDVSNYDRYILNDHVGNVFIGTEDSEYVVVGSGGGNILEAGNGDPTDIASNVKVKNFQFDSAGIVRETDIVDYSQLNVAGNLGITVDLGESAYEAVSVAYNGKTDSVTGFEGVVGSRGHDFISGSDVGNALAGGAGNDVLRGYTGAEDKLYTPAVVDYGIKGPDSTNFKEAQFLVDSSDILYGGAGDDDLYGGAGRDMLLDLGKADMWGSDKKGFNGLGIDEPVDPKGRALRDSSRKDLAENDVFWVRGDDDVVGPTAETATIHNFHLSKDGTGLAGRSNSANDALLFAIDTTKIFGPSTNSSFTTNEALYNHVYSRLSFEQKTNSDNDNIELVVNYKQDIGSQAIKVGSTIIADMGSMLDGGKNRAEVVELKWLSKGDDPLALFNPKIDLDLIRYVDDEFGSSSMNIAVALELLQAGTVRGTNDFGVMAAKLSDKNLDERIYNPGDKDDRILGTAKNDSYEYVVQQFTPTLTTPAPGTVITDQVGKDAIFDIGGNNDVLMFESARIQDLTFSAVKVGRESKANSLKVVHKQTEALDDGLVENQGEVVWQGHYKAGGRQELEVLKIGTQEFALAQAVYEYNSKGYAKGGPKITADNARDVIMVGQGAGDKFVFDFDPAAVRVGTSNTQLAHIAGFDSADRIDISDYVTQYGSATASMAGGKAVVNFGVDAFKLELTFQEFSPATDEALQLALYGTIPT